MAIKYSKALIVGSGSGLSASLAHLFAREGFKVALAARNTEKLAPLCSSTGAVAFSCDASDPRQVARLFQDVETRIGAPDVVVYNASARSRGPFISLDAAEVETGDQSKCVWRLSRCAAGSKAHGAARPWRNSVYRGLGEREGLCPVSALRHGQVRPAGPCAKHGP